MTPSATPANTIIRRNAWQSAWRATTSDAALAALAIALCTLLTLAALLPQVPQGNPTAYSRWLSDVQLRFGGAVGLMTALGLFDVAHSLAFRVVAALAGPVLTARLADRLHDFREAAHPTPPPESPAQSVETGVPVEEILKRLERYRIRKTDSCIIADRFPWAHLGAMAAHLGPIILLAGLAISPLTDWRVESLSVLPDTTTPIPNTAYAVQASRIDPRSGIDLTLYQDGAPIAQGTAAPHQPWLSSSLGFFVRETLPALLVTGINDKGDALDLISSAHSAPQKELLLTFSADKPDAFFVAPDAQLAIRVSLAKLQGVPRYDIIAFSNSTGALVGQIDDESIGPPVTFNDHDFMFSNASHAVLSVAHAPAQMIILIGVVVAMIGFALMARLPEGRIWIFTEHQPMRLVSDHSDIDLDTILASGDTR